MNDAATARGARSASVTVATRRNDVERRDRAIAEEAAVAIEINGLGYAVMMATPIDLVDFGIGFALSEGIAETARNIFEVEPIAVEKGWLLRLTVDERGFADVRERVRHRVAEGSCGLCGLDNIDQVLRPLPPVGRMPDIGDGAIFAALDRLRAHQRLNKETGAVHGAALCARDGAILLCREDIGRHNATDKLIGAAARAEMVLGDKFILLTSRCSFELVEKAVRAKVPMLVTISAASTLAIERAVSAGLTLVSLARPDSLTVVSDPRGMFGTH